MAEASALTTTPLGSSTPVEEADRDLCAVCLEPYVHPAKLPCGHIFCFLCIKGTANRSKRCAMCRQEIPHDFIEKPTLVDNIEDKSLEYQWYYEGRNGWWQYDERTSKELEAAYKNGERSCELLVAGFLYVMDLEAMLQLRRNDPSRRRRIKRDKASIDRIGIAGLRCPAIKNIKVGSNAVHGDLREMTGIEHVEVAPHQVTSSEEDSQLTEEDDSQRTIICDSPTNLTFTNESFVDLEED